MHGAVLEILVGFLSNFYGHCITKWSKNKRKKSFRIKPNVEGMMHNILSMLVQICIQNYGLKQYPNLTHPNHYKIHQLYI